MQKFIRLRRLITGYVTFEAKDGFPDRFFDECRKNNIALFNIRRQGGAIYADVFKNDYLLMHAARKRSDMKVKIVKRHGLPFFVNKRKNRLGLVLGATVFFILMAVLSSRIWSLNVVGNENVDTNDIMDAYKNEGIFVGGKLSSLGDIGEEHVVEAVDGVIWSSADNSGISTTIKVKEGTAVPEIKNDVIPGNVIAKCDGRIIKYEVYDGTEEQVVNAAVTKGDLLISGVLTFVDGSVMLKPAEGRVLAETTRSVEFSLDKDYPLFSVAKLNKKNRLEFFGISIGINKRKKAPVFEQFLDVNNVVLPIGLTTEYDFKLFPAKLNANRKLSVTLNEYFKKQSIQTDNCEIRENSISVDSNDKGILVKGKLDLIEDIGEFQRIELE